MPTYRYRCFDCGHEFDQFQRFSEDALTVCPSCSGTIRRVIQPVGVVFKGSGWYVTDSRKNDSAPAKTDGTKPDAEKPAAKSEPAAAKTESADPKPAKTESKVAAAI